MIQGGQLIGNKTSQHGEDTFVAYAPREERDLPERFHEASGKDVDQALQLAHQAAPTLRQTSLEERAHLLELIADNLESSLPIIEERCALETGYPDTRVAMEGRRMVHLWRLFAEEVRGGAWLEARIDTGEPDRLPLPKPDLRSMRMAIGPVVIFGASNFPLALSVAGSDPISALGAGCPVVVKGHPSHPGTSEWLGRAILDGIQAAGFPEGTFSMLQGKGHDVGTALVTHPNTRAVGFTGSLRGGRALMDLAAGRLDPIPVYAEMGSVNPQFVYPDILANDAEGLAERLFASVTMGNGQFCTCPSIVFLPRSKDADRFLDTYHERVIETPAAPLLNTCIAIAYRQGLDRWETIPGLTVRHRGPTEEAAFGVLDAHHFLDQREVLLEEVFGPASLFVLCEDQDEFPTLAEAFPGQLGASIHGTDKDLQEVSALLNELHRFAGRIVINGFPTGIETCHAMHHGGPYPATSDPLHTSLGLAALARWARPVSFQNTPTTLLPEALQDENPLGIPRLLNGRHSASTAP